MSSAPGRDVGKEILLWQQKRFRTVRRRKAVAGREVHIVWITAGLGCDGDSVSITAATQPSIEDVLLGAIPGLPKVHLHNPVLAYEVGDDFMKYFYQAEEGKLDPFVLVVEGSIPNEKIKRRRLLGGVGTDSNTGQPIRPREWIDRLAPKALAVVGASAPAPPTAAFTPWQAIPTGCMGLADYLGLGLALQGRLAHRQRSRLPGAARQLHGDRALPALSGGRPGAHDSARRCNCGPPGCSARPCTKAATAPATTSRAISPTEYGSPKCIVKLGCWGPVVNCNVPKRGWMAGIGGCPNVGGICIGCTMPGFPDKFMPFMDEPPGARVSTAALGALRQGDHAPCAAFTNQHGQQGTEVAARAAPN